MKRTWSIPVTWEMCGRVEIEAETKEEAIEIFKDVMQELPLPEESYYVDDSFELSTDNIEELKAMIFEVEKEW